MNQIINFIFSIIILIFTILIVYNVISDNSDNLRSQEVTNEINLITEKINQFCLDPFISKKININYIKPFTYYYNKTRVCAKAGDEIYCKRTKCDIGENIILNNNSIEIEYKCHINNSNKIEIEC